MPGLVGKKVALSCLGLSGKVSGSFSKKTESIEDKIIETCPTVKCEVKHIFKKEETYEKYVDLYDPDLMSCQTLSNLIDKVKDKVIKIPCTKKRSDGTEYQSWNYVFDDHDAIGGNLIEEVFLCPTEFIKAWRQYNKIKDLEVMTKEEIDRRKSLSDGTKIFLGQYINDHKSGRYYDHLEIDNVYRNYHFSPYQEYKCYYVDIDGRGGPDSERIIYIEI